MSILSSSTNIATYREEKMVGRPCPIIKMNTGKVVRDREAVVISHLEELGKEIPPWTVKEVDNRKGIS